jgi:hypothetical protein
MEIPGLLERCAENMRAGRIDTADVENLRRWNAAFEPHSAPVAAGFLAAPTADWDRLVTGHAAYGHHWYDFICDGITIDEIAAFLLENHCYPRFLTLLERIREAQLGDDARAAIDDNIHDEHHPEPHADLMRRLMLAVKARARPDLRLSLYPSLIHRTLIYYYGFFCDPWHLVGAVFATERLGTRRMVCMHEGLRRLGLTEHELMFTTIHIECDDHHAGDWLDRVIVPSSAVNPAIRARIACGIAACLETSRDYLDFLTGRIMTDRSVIAGASSYAPGIVGSV